MIKESNTLSENLVTVLPNIVSTTYLRKIETADAFVDYVCGFTPAGSVTLSEYSITPKKLNGMRNSAKKILDNYGRLKKWDSPLITILYQQPNKVQYF